MTINEAVHLSLLNINKFKEDWYNNHKINPEQYPLELDEDDSGLWFEFICNAIMEEES